MTCASACYARSGHYRFPDVTARLQWNYDQTLAPNFADRMIREVREKGCLVVRAHASGDFYSHSYCRDWLRVMKACGTTKFYCYTRSHVVPDSASVLERMARLKNARVWYSFDRDIPVPERLPKGVRSCYLMTEEDEPVPKVDLVFRVRRLRKHRVPLALVCPSESPRKRDVVCGSCTKCFR